MVDRTGKRYGMLVVLEWEKNTIDKRGEIIPWWKCQCDCGKTRIVRGSDLQQGAAKDCGCRRAMSDITGNRYGNLVVKKMYKKGKKPYYECICDCGNSVNVCRYYLLNGKKTCCNSCMDKSRPNRIKDLTGQRYGRLTVLKRDENVYYTAGGNRLYKWECQCECGTIFSVERGKLKSGKTTSCGCYQAEKFGLTTEEYRKRFAPIKGNSGTFSDLTGMRYGKLVVREQSATSKAGKIKWLCDCDCGGTVIVVGNNLKNGHTQSCGCIDSVGESRISRFLDLKGFDYKKELTYADCRDKHPLPFDFGIKKSNKVVAIIEYDGLQHFEPVRFNGMTHERSLSSFEDCKKHDKIKNEYCERNNIPLLRIKYDEMDNLEEKIEVFLQGIV